MGSTLQFLFFLLGSMPIVERHAQERGGSMMPRGNNMPMGSNMPGGVPLKPGVAACPGGASCPGRAACPGKHAKKAECPGGVACSLKRASSITGFYIASLHEIEDSFVLASNLKYMACGHIRYATINHNILHRAHAFRHLPRAPTL
jgi:hypothetical protein